MTNIDKDTANWRLFGGGGLLVGGLLWLIARILGVAGVDSPLNGWLTAIGLIVIGVGFFLVAWGQTGSNGAVGNNQVGKFALFAAALGFLAWGVIALLGLLGVSLGADVHVVLNWVVVVLIVLGAVIAAVIIKQKEVARGLAVWAMFVVALVAILYFIANFVPDLFLGGWLVLIFAAAITLTGLLYLLNKK